MAIQGKRHQRCPPSPAANGGFAGQEVAMIKTQTIRIPTHPSPIWDGDRVFEAPGGPMVYPVKAKDITIPNLFGGTVLAKRVEFMEVKASKRLSSSINVEVSPKGLLDCIGLVSNGQVLAVVGRGSEPKRTLVVVEPQALKEPEVFEALSGLLLKEGFESLPVEGRIKLGGKPEFEVVLGGVVVPAESYLPPEEGFEPPVRSEWHILKVEPHFADTPGEYLENFYALIRGIECDLSVEGDVYPILGIMCLSAQDMASRNVLRIFSRDVAKILDDFVGRVLLPTYGRACWEEKFARLENFWLTPYGLDYAIPSSIYAEGETLRTVYKLAKSLLETLLREGEVSYRTKEGYPLREEYLRFLSEEELDTLLSFPQRFRKGEKLVPVEVVSHV